MQFGLLELLGTIYLYNIIFLLPFQYGIHSDWRDASQEINPAIYRPAGTGAAIIRSVLPTLSGPALAPSQYRFQRFGFLTIPFYSARFAE
jgi:hypothetical protein